MIAKDPRAIMEDIRRIQYAYSPHAQIHISERMAYRVSKGEWLAVAREVDSMNSYRERWSRELYNWRPRDPRYDTLSIYGVDLIIDERLQTFKPQLTQIIRDYGSSG